MIVLLLFLYICMGAIITYALRHLYLSADYYEYTGSCSDNDVYCVVVGIFWPVAAPFAFAMYFAQYGIPKDSKKRGKDE